MFFVPVRLTVGARQTRLPGANKNHGRASKCQTHLQKPGKWLSCPIGQSWIQTYHNGWESYLPFWLSETWNKTVFESIIKTPFPQILKPYGEKKTWLFTYCYKSTINQFGKPTYKGGGLLISNPVAHISNPRGTPCKESLHFFCNATQKWKDCGNLLDYVHKALQVS